LSIVFGGGEDGRLRIMEERVGRCYCMTEWEVVGSCVTCTARVKIIAGPQVRRLSWRVNVWKEDGRGEGRNYVRKRETREIGIKYSNARGEAETVLGKLAGMLKEKKVLVWRLAGDTDDEDDEDDEMIRNNSYFVPLNQPEEGCMMCISR
jgi:hypothetical protein